MTALISPAEPPLIRAAGQTSTVPEQYGCDVLLAASWGLVGIQRKRFPEDLLASMNSDDRMSRLVLKMEPLAMRIMLLEGRPTWTLDGKLVHDYHSFSRASLHGLCLSLQFNFGVATYWTEDQAGTVGFIETLEDWCSKPRHDSLLSRGGAPRNAWLGQSNASWSEFMLQGIEGIGPELARRIIAHFGEVPLRWSVSEEQLLEVPGLGPGRLAKMTKVVPLKGET